MDGTRRHLRVRTRIAGLLAVLLVALAGVVPAPASAASLDPLEVVDAAAAGPDTLLLIVQHIGDTVLQNVSVAWEDATGTHRHLAVPTTAPGMVLTLPLVADWAPGPHVVSVHYVSALDAAYTRTQDIVLHLEPSGDAYEVLVPQEQRVQVEFDGDREASRPHTAMAWVVLIGAVVALPLEIGYGVWRRKKREDACSKENGSETHGLRRRSD